MAFAQPELSSLKNCEKPAQQIDSRVVADLAHHILLRTLMQSMIWCSVIRMYHGHTKLPVRLPGKLAFRGGQWDASQRHSANVPEETSRTGVNCVEQSVIDQAFDQWRDYLNACVKAKGKHIHICSIMLRCVCP